MYLHVKVRVCCSRPKCTLPNTVHFILPLLTVIKVSKATGYSTTLCDAAIRLTVRLFVSLSLRLSHVNSTVYFRAMVTIDPHTAMSNPLVIVANRQWSRCRRLFRSICQMTATSICPVELPSARAYRFAALYIVPSRTFLVSRYVPNCSCFEFESWWKCVVCFGPLKR